jgi:hypothetical protein
MPKKILISLIIFLTVFCFSIFNPRKIGVIEAQGPIAAMKTRVNGYFYVPALNPESLKVVFLFSNPDLEGDQIGGPAGEYSIVPDGVVDITDLVFIKNNIGLTEGSSNWEYMADISADKTVDVGDYSITKKNVGKSGTYIYDLTGVTILFDTGNEVGLDSTGKANIPAKATSFTVKKNGSPIGAYILFYAGAAPKTCAQLGGTCCPSGQTCTAGKISGASDCSECCSNAANCSLLCAQLGGTCCPSGQTCIAGEISGASDCSECCSDVANCQSGGEGGESGGSSFFNIINPLACNTIPECIEKIISFILWIGTAIFPIIIIIGGFLFLISGGDPEKVRTAKRMIFWAVIGLVIVLLARGIISVIKSVIAK